MRRGGALAATLALWAGMACAQDDRDFLTAFLEDNLSGAGRTVTITGFEGALSAEASIERLEIADAGGVWITLEGVVLDWSRSSLLSGEVVVNELSARRIALARLPVAEADGPVPEAQPFALPELPVSIEIGQIAAEAIVLGPDVLGEALEGRLEASLSLAGGAGEGALLIERTDGGPQARIALAAGFDNASGRLSVDLDAREAAGGIVAGLLGLPGRPATALSLAGEGTLADFAADLRLESDGVERLSGPVRLTGGEDGVLAFAADVSGNPAPLFAPQYAAFLGDRVALVVEGRRNAGGRLWLDALSLEARALRLTGAAELAGDGLPERLAIDLTVGLPDGAPVLLPLPGEAETRIAGAGLRLDFDAAQDAGWSARAGIEGLERDGLTLARLSFEGSGRIDRVAGRRGLGGTLELTLAGIAGLDPALAQALGPDLAADLVFHWREGSGVLSLPRIALAGEGYAGTAALTVDGLDAALMLRGRIEAAIADLSRLSALTGQSPGGGGVLRLEGEASPLTGAFDLAIDLAGEGIRIGQAQADRLLAGRSVLMASLRRDETGISLRSLDASAASLRLTASGTLDSAGSVLEGRLDLGDLADLDPGLGGALSGAAQFSGTSEEGRLSLSGEVRNPRMGEPALDRVLAGTSVLDLSLALSAAGIAVERMALTGPNLTAETREAGGGALSVTARLRDLALVTPEFPGPLSLSGTVTPPGNGWAGDLRLVGPAGIDARIAGSVMAGRPDLTIRGAADAAAANGLIDPVTLAGALGYDLRLSGGWGLSALAGRVTLAAGRIAVPLRGLSLQDVAMAADLAAGQARLTATAAAPRGGRLRVDGPVGLTAPFDAALAITLDAIALRDPELFETRISGGLSLTGPLLGRAALRGDLVLDGTELRVPSTGFATAADLEAIAHVNDSAPVRETRRRAGVGTGGGQGAGGGGGGPDWLLDVTLSEGNRLFVRGRGLDAELGGTVRLGGSLRNIVPSGQLDLIRGRLDILGKRLDLDEASVTLEGALIPWIRVSASNMTAEVTSIVTIEGPANAPEITFSSVPELPQEEVLAWLLFGRGLDTISAFQAAQLANAVAVLAGRGGEGIIGQLRKGFGFDDLDISTAEDGGATVRAGKYISDNVYTEIGVDEDGKSRINLNLDLRPGVTVRGRVDSDGESGIGIYLEKDY